MGAMTALQVAVRIPERLRTLVVIGITTERQPRADVARRLLDPDRVAADDPVWAAALARMHDPIQGPAAWRTLLRAIVDDIDVQPLLGPGDLHAIDAPTLVGCGDRDPLVPVAQAAALARQVRDGRLLVAPGSGHDVVHERADVVAAALAAFHRSTATIAAARAGDPQEVTR
jgi:pimeloyl-ACP methyl ester carboxylesterase